MAGRIAAGDAVGDVLAPSADPRPARAPPSPCPASASSSSGRAAGGIELRQRGQHRRARHVGRSSARGRRVGRTQRRHRGGGLELASACGGGRADHEVGRASAARGSARRRPGAFDGRRAPRCTAGTTRTRRPPAISASRGTPRRRAARRAPPPAPRAPSSPRSASSPESVAMKVSGSTRASARIAAPRTAGARSDEQSTRMSARAGIGQRRQRGHRLEPHARDSCAGSPTIRGTERQRRARRQRGQRADRLDHHRRVARLLLDDRGSQLPTAASPWPRPARAPRTTRCSGPGSRASASSAGAARGSPTRCSA